MIQKSHALMLGIILIAISIGTVATVMPVAEFTIPLDAYDSQSVGATGATGEPQKQGVDGGSISGWVEITVLDGEGNIIAERSDHNLIVTDGLGVTSDLLFGTTHESGEGAGNMKYIQLGTGTVNPSAGDSDCGTIAGSKVADANIENTATGAIINATWTTQLNGLSISEICLTDNATNATGNLFARQEYTPIAISGTYTVNAEWTITFADSDGT